LLSPGRRRDPRGQRGALSQHSSRPGGPNVRRMVASAAHALRRWRRLRSDQRPNPRMISANPRLRRFVEPSALGGFWPALGFTLCYLSFFVLLPLAALALRPWELGFGGVWRILSAPRTTGALELSFGAAFIAACINIVFGTIAAWSLVRYEFPGK